MVCNKDISNKKEHIKAMTPRCQRREYKEELSVTKLFQQKVQKVKERLICKVRSRFLTPCDSPEVRRNTVRPAARAGQTL